MELEIAQKLAQIANFADAQYLLGVVDGLNAARETGKQENN